MAVEIGGLPLRSSTIRSRAITMENPTGAVGAGGHEVGGRKGAPCLRLFAKDQVFTLASIEGSGVIRHIWITIENMTPRKMRNMILRFYWDGQEQPSVEAPIGDFFGISHGLLRQHESAFISMPEGKGLNCFFPMPFARNARLTITNETGEDSGMLFFQVDYTIGDAVTADTPLFHAQFRRVPRTRMYEDYVILDGVRGAGRFLGMNLGLVDEVENMRIWWGEGEVKMYIDGDTTHPTICGTGTEDYVGTAWGMGVYTMQSFGAPVVDVKYKSVYRWHDRDPIYFNESLKVTVQQIGNDGTVEPTDPNGPLAGYIRQGRYRKDRPDGNFEREDDVCSTAYWYQTLPTVAFPPFPDRELRSRNLPASCW